MRRRLLAIAALGLLMNACGGSSTTGPTTRDLVRFRNVNGTWQISVSYDAFTTSQARASGTITFVQNDLGAANMTGSANVVSTVATSQVLVTVMTAATMTASDRVFFRLGADLTNPWEFEGTLSADGREIRGTHILGKGSSTPFPGSWVASK